MNWSEGELGDFLTLKRGHDLPKGKRKAGEVPVVSSSGFTGWHDEPKAAPPGVVTGRYGTIGEVFYVDQPYWPLNTALYVIDFKGNDPRFVSYFLRQQLKNYQSDKAAVPGVDRNVLHKLPAKCPDPQTQQAIARILSAYDDLIENNRRRIALLEEAARQLYKEWFVRFRFPGHEHVKIIDGVPEGWTHGTVSHLGWIVTGKTPSKKVKENYGGNIPFIKTPDMHGNSLVLSTSETLSERGANSQSKKTLPSGAVLVSCIGTVGVVAMTATSAQFNQQINAVIPQRQSWQFFCYFLLKSVRPMLEAIGGGATMANVNKTKFGRIPVSIPKDDLLIAFDERVRSSFDLIENLSRQNSELTKARDLLLPKLMNGSLTV